jgi:hypothetical protein
MQRGAAREQTEATAQSRTRRGEDALQQSTSSSPSSTLPCSMFSRDMFVENDRKKQQKRK